MLPKGNMQQLMKQAQQMQKKMEEAQKELEAKEVTGTAGGGMVTVVATGKKTLKSIKIEPEILQEDPEMVEDMIVAAVNQAMQQVDDLTQNTLRRYYRRYEYPRILKEFSWPASPKLLQRSNDFFQNSPVSGVNPPGVSRFI